VGQNLDPARPPGKGVRRPRSLRRVHGPRLAGPRPDGQEPRTRRVGLCRGAGGPAVEFSGVGGVGGFPQGLARADRRIVGDHRQIDFHRARRLPGKRLAGALPDPRARDEGVGQRAARGVFPEVS